MSRTRPTVTIDLEEYKELQEYKERFKIQNSEITAAALNLVTTFYTYGENRFGGSLSDFMAQNGIELVSRKREVDRVATVFVRAKQK